MCTPGLHHYTSIRLLFIADFHHIDLAFYPEKGTAERQGAPPLPCSGLRGNPLGPGYLVVICLGNGRVRFMAPCRAYPLVFVIDPCGCAKIFFETIGPVKRGRAPQQIFFQDFLRDINFPVLAYFLLNKRHGKNGGQVLRSNRFSCSGMQWRFQRGGQVGQYIIPLARQF